MSWLRRRPVPLILLGSSAIGGGAAYRLLAPPADSSTSLHPHAFTPYTLVDKEPVSSTSAIFTLRNHGHPASADSQHVREAWKQGVWSLQIKQPQLQIARAYTPLPPVRSATIKEKEGSREEEEDEEQTGQQVRLLIRQEPGGEVSTYLHQLPLKSTLELRGPHAEFELPPAQVRDVVFLAGGTGIAPAMQMARALGDVPGCRMHILWANRRREECVGGVSDGEDGDTTARRWFHGGGGGGGGVHQAPLAGGDAATQGALVSELDALKRQGEARDSRLWVQYFVDEEGSFVRPRDVLRRIRGGGGVSSFSSSSSSSSSQDETPGSRLIVVAGPDGFVEYWAGRKVWVGGREMQGPLGGQLGRMELGGWSVVKL